MNEVVSAYRGIGARVWVIDVGRSYQNLIRLQKGTFLEFTPSTKLCINPFSWVGTDDELDFKSEMRMLANDRPHGVPQCAADGIPVRADRGGDFRQSGKTTGRTPTRPASATTC